jgi:hypothetical protein
MFDYIVHGLILYMAPVLRNFAVPQILRDTPVDIYTNRGKARPEIELAFKSFESIRKKTGEKLGKRLSKFRVFD